MKGKDGASGKTMSVSNFLAETVPAEVEQDRKNGPIKELSKAKATQWSFFIENGLNEDIDETMYEVWEEKL